ncbi:MAG: YeeE/YedE thiosulfate transporter family protein [Gammaproteobacteria bacterium]
MHDYLTWWLGGIALGAFTIIFRLLTHRTLGVSGSWKKMLSWREERAHDKTAQTMAAHQDDVAAALMAETLAEFGMDTLESPAGDAPQAKPKTPAAAQPVPWTAHVVFLAAMVLGGFLWAAATGNLALQFELSAIHQQWTGGGWTSAFILLMGGFMVGLGTQMAGGCSSGHGLSGCANFSATSFSATAVFFLTAVLVSAVIKVMFL